VAARVHHVTVVTGVTEADVRALPLAVADVRLQDGMAFVSAVGGFTPADVDRLPDDGRRYELLDGVIVVTPAPTRSHQRALVKLSALLLAAEVRPALTLVAPYDVTLAPTRRVQPDVLVFRAPDDPLPALVIEVASPSTVRYDREQKLRAYADAGVPSYWLVDAGVPAVEVLALDAGGYRRVLAAQGEEEVVVTDPLPVRFRPADLVD
jgi:Uma2 family endonuclease